MAETQLINKVRPQEGYQMKALSSPADIVIGGGAAGSGKTYSLLLEFLRHINNKEFGGVIFRRTSPQIRLEGGLWDTSMNIYPHVGASPKESMLEWGFKSGARLKFSHLEYEKNVFDWQGSQICFLGFDELTHFSEKMFFYLLSRNRSTCGVKPYVRATCNPDPDSWVAKLIEWWIDEETGLPIPERDGAVRYFVKSGDDYVWGDTKTEVIEKAWHFLEPIAIKAGISPDEFVKSITFVAGSIYDNRALLGKDPAYLANLISQDEQTRVQLLDGNWKVVVSDKDIYDYGSFVGMFTNVRTVSTEGRYITADIALKGSDKFIVGAWHGRELADIRILPKSDGEQVINAIKELAQLHDVPNNHITFDNDGVGGFVDGFIKGAIPFSNGGSPLPVKDPISDKKITEKYANLKTQCFYRSGDRVRNGDYRVSEQVANMMYDTKMTIRQRFVHERKAIKRDKIDNEQKLHVIPKSEMKVKLNGESPDLMDMFMMREIFDLKIKSGWQVL